VSLQLSRIKVCAECSKKYWIKKCIQKENHQNDIKKTIVLTLKRNNVSTAGEMVKKKEILEKKANLKHFLSVALQGIPVGVLGVF